AEWEYACRAGTGGLYGGNDDPKSLARVANVTGKATAPVGSFEPNGWHLHDMIGNVWEWCDDWFDPKFYQTSPTENPGCAARASHRVIRGGSWFSHPRDCRPAFRFGFAPGLRYDSLGFRLAAVRE